MSAVIAAAFSLMCEAKDMRDASGNKITTRMISTVIRVAPHTVGLRRGEIRSALLKLASPLPWSKGLNVNNIHGSLLYIIKHFETLRKARNAQMNATDGCETANGFSYKDSVYPPSFEVGQKTREKRREKIDRAKDRMAGGVKDISPLDEEDILIERLLREGVAEHLLVNGYYEAAYSSSIVYDPIGISDPLGDSDIAEEDMHMYIRTAADVSCYAAVRGPFGENEGQKAPKRRKINSSPSEKAEQDEPLQIEGNGPVKDEEETATAAKSRAEPVLKTSESKADYVQKEEPFTELLYESENDYASSCDSDSECSSD